MTTAHDKVREYYAGFDEWQRLDSVEGAIEFQQMLRVLRDRLRPDSKILDLGGGPGRYAIELARWGHRVVLADLSPALLEAAKARATSAGVLARILSMDEANAVDLSRYDNATFDAVVALGPFYHLTEPQERRAAAHEIRRVLRPDGTAFVAFIPRLSGLKGLIERGATAPDQLAPDTLRVAAETGVFRNATRHGFQEGHYPYPEEIAGLFAAEGFRVVDMLSLRSIADGMGSRIEQLNPNQQDNVAQIADSVRRRPDVIATCGHAVLVAQPSQANPRAEEK